MTRDLPKRRVCRKCGAAVPSVELDGLCPSCVARLAFLFDAGSAPARDFPAMRLHKFGDYELIEEIARGGMGVVYKARQISPKRTVAVKMILSGQLASPADIQRFRAEAEAAANLRHPNIVAIHEVGEHDGQHYFSMDHVEGRSLADAALAGRERTLEWSRRAATYVKTVAEAIEYAISKTHRKVMANRSPPPVGNGARRGSVGSANYDHNFAQSPSPCHSAVRTGGHRSDACRFRPGNLGAH